MCLFQQTINHLVDKDSSAASSASHKNVVTKFEEDEAMKFEGYQEVGKFCYVPIGTRLLRRWLMVSICLFTFAVNFHRAIQSFWVGREYLLDCISIWHLKGSMLLTYFPFSAQIMIAVIIMLQNQMLVLANPNC